MLFLLACADPDPVGILSADDTRTGTDGADGPYGVLLAAEADGNPQTDIFRPVDGEGNPADVGDAAVTVLLIPGGAVAPERYHWLAEHLTTRGATVLVPHFGFNLAIFSPDAGLRALDHAEKDGLLPDAPVAAMGHSLGGVVAAMNWTDDPRISGLGLLASYPADGTEVESVEAGTVVSLLGTADEKVDREKWETGNDRFVAPMSIVEIEGMNHYDWTDDATAKELKSDGESTRSLTETRRDAQRVIDAWVDQCITGTSASWDALVAALPEGVALDGTPCAAGG